MLSKFLAIDRYYCNIISISIINYGPKLLKISHFHPSFPPLFGETPRLFWGSSVKKFPDHLLPSTAAVHILLLAAPTMGQLVKSISPTQL